jgi:hypothetical protein
LKAAEAEEGEKKRKKWKKKWHLGEHAGQPEERQNRQT